MFWKKKNNVSEKEVPAEPSGCEVEVFGNGLGTKVYVDGHRIKCVKNVEEKMNLGDMEVCITFVPKKMEWHSETKLSSD